MRRRVLGGLAAMCVAGAAYAAGRNVLQRETDSVTSSAAAPHRLSPAPLLRFDEFFQPGAGLEATAKLRALNGQRVRLVGFMAQMELPPRGAFYLVPRPVRCDEAGGGTADLPLESVLVLSESAAGREIAFLEGALEVSGVLEVGNHAEADGRVSAFRLRLDRGADAAQRSGAI